MAEQSTITYSQNGEERTRTLGEETLRIGRHEDNELVLDNPYISRYHVEIFAEGPKHFIRDLGSTSGTFANGERITQRQLRDGDAIRLGRGRGVEFVFHSTASEAAAVPGDELKPVRVIPPEETLFINTRRLPQSGDLAEKTIERLRALYEFTTELLTIHSSDDLSDRLAAFLHRAIRSDRSAVLLWNFSRKCLEVSAACGKEELIAPSRKVTDLAYTQNVAVLSLDASTDARFSGDSVRFGSIRSVICAPMGSKGRIWGVCYLDNVDHDRAFDDESLDFVTAVARQAGLAMENLYLLDEQRRSLESFIGMLAASLDARDDNTAGHSARVAALASGIARELGIDEQETRAVYYAGLLHDYGKIGIRDDVLLKPAELTAEEYETIKEHPLHTFRLLSKIRFPEDLADIPMVAASHHERWDGSGYPQGIKGEHIPLGSRIVAVADAYDAITEERCYSEPMSPSEALGQLTSRAGTYFDPTIVDAFVRYFENEIKPRSRRHNERVNTLKEPVSQLFGD